MECIQYHTVLLTRSEGIVLWRKVLQFIHSMALYVLEAVYVYSILIVYNPFLHFFGH